MNSKLLNHYLEQNQTRKSLSDLLSTIARAGKYVAHAIRTGDLGMAGTSNLFGENQLELDVLADKIFTRHMKESGLVYKIASEEKPDEEIINENGKYSVSFDPLDGSSLVDANLAIGAIFGIFRSKNFIGHSGRDMVAACYVIFGPRTSFVVAIEDQVMEFVMNELGEFAIAKKNIKIDEIAKTFSPGNLRACKENPKYDELVNFWKDIPLTLRYSGGMVPDIHAIFAKGGGIFSYPPYSKYPNGKLRLIFECAPFAYLAEKAGGMAVNEKGENILDIKIEKIHQRTPIFIGSKNEVERAMEFLK